MTATPTKSTSTTAPTPLTPLPVTHAAAATPSSHSTRTSPWVTLLSGLSSGILSTLLLQPFDVAKTSLINPHQRSSGMIALFQRIHSESGWTGMWRGVGPALVRISIGSGVYFTTQTQLLALIRQEMHESGAKPNAPVSSQALLAVGFLSRASAVTVCCPISVVKTRIEGNSVAPYRGLIHGLSTIWRTEGVRGIYTGLIPSVLKDSPYSAVYLLLYSRLKTLFVTWDERFHWSSHDPSTIQSGQHPLIQFSAAFLAGGFATALFQPTEVIKTRLQLARLSDLAAASSASTVAPSSTSTSLSFLPRHRVWTMVGRIYREDGPKGFVRGLLPRIIRRSLSNAWGWMVFEQMVQFWSGTTGL